MPGTVQGAGVLALIKQQTLEEGILGSDLGYTAFFLWVTLSDITSLEFRF